MISELMQLGNSVLKECGGGGLNIKTPVLDDGKEHLNLNIVFDLDSKQIIIDSENLSQYSESSIIELNNLKIPSGNSNNYCFCVLFDKNMKQFKKTFFGSGKCEKGEFVRLIDAEFGDLVATQVYNAVLGLYQLNTQHEKLDCDVIRQTLMLGSNSQIVLCYASVISKEHGICTKTNITKLIGYSEFIKLKFGVSEPYNSGLCYATGLVGNNIIQPNFKDRYSINKIFVKSTINSASGFDGNGRSKNFSISEDSMRILELASKYLLENLNIQIAGIPHVIIPHAINNGYFDIPLLKKIKNKCDFLFTTKLIQEAVEDVIDEFPTSVPMVLTFVAFESNGTFLKIINRITDFGELNGVNKYHFEKINEIFVKTKICLCEYIRLEEVFNFGTMYSLIPTGESQNPKKNEAIEIFSSILEHRTLDSSDIFKHFSELVRCYKLGKYDAYTNIKKNNNIDFAINNAVIKYLAFFNVLLELKQLSNHNFCEVLMENEGLASLADNTHLQCEFDYFKKMHLSDIQKSLFFLGRMLNCIGYAQYQKNHKQKPILDKINYNGMDRDGIVRLSIDLVEKAKQYNIGYKIERTHSEFVKYFNFNTWTVNPCESLFFILAGYTFRLKKDEEEINNKIIEDEDE